MKLALLVLGLLVTSCAGTISNYDRSTVCFVKCAAGSAGSTCLGSRCMYCEVPCDAPPQAHAYVCYEQP